MPEIIYTPNSSGARFDDINFGTITVPSYLEVSQVNSVAIGDEEDGMICVPLDKLAQCLAAMSPDDRWQLSKLEENVADAKRSLELVEQKVAWIQSRHVNDTAAQASFQDTELEIIWRALARLNGADATVCKIKRGKPTL